MIPIYFHNFTGYDAKHLMVHVTEPSVHLTGAMMESSERVTTFTYKYLYVFRDSLKLLNAGLGALVKSHHQTECLGKQATVRPEVIAYAKNLTGDSLQRYQARMADLAERENVRTGWSLTTQMLDRQYSHATLTDSDRVNLIKNKGEFAYTWYDSPDRENETTLPPAEQFKKDSTVSNEVAEKARQRAVETWQLLGMSRFSDYVDFYCLLDVCQLADILLLFQDNFFKKYGIDPLHFNGIAGASFDAMLHSVHKNLSAKYEIYKAAREAHMDSLRVRFKMGGENKSEKELSSYTYIYLCHTNRDIEEGNRLTSSLAKYFYRHERSNATYFTPEIPNGQDMYDYIIGAIRGGLSGPITRRYAACDEYIRMWYIDYKSQYPTAMTHALPLGNYN